MRKLILFLFLLGALSASAAELVTATISITNGTGTTNGQTITVNGVTRTWTNNVVAPGSQILTNNTATGAATNLYNEFSTYPFSGLSLGWASPTNVTLFTASPSVGLIVTLSANWGTVSYSTQAVTSGYVVRVPMTVEPAGPRTNIASLLTTGINDYSTNAFFENAPAVQHLAGLTNNQTISGRKIFTNTTNIFYGGTYGSPVTTNLINRGNAISSVGVGSLSEQFGSGATASGNAATALGYGTTASGDGSLAVGNLATASGTDAIAIGDLASATAANSIAIGGEATAPGSVAMGSSSTASHTNATVIGFGASSTANNQVVLGITGISVLVNSDLSVAKGATIAKGVTNLWTTGTNTFLAGSDVAYTRYALSSLSTGNNAAIPVGTNVFVEVSGPGGAFTINGINGGPNRDGKFLILLNMTGQNMTIAHDSGVDPTAGNRIYTMTGADRSTTGNGAAMLIYSASASRWMLISLDQ